MDGPEWVPTGEVRLVNRKVADAVGVDLKPVPLYERVLQQRFKRGSGVGVYTVPEYEWRDVSVESEYIIDMDDSTKARGQMENKPFTATDALRQKEEFFKGHKTDQSFPIIDFLCDKTIAILRSKGLIS